MIQAAHPLTVTRRCELLGVARSTVYAHPTGLRIWAVKNSTVRSVATVRRA